MTAIHLDRIIMLQIILLSSNIFSNILSFTLVTATFTESEVDPNGYILYCPCMGRFGNQADHFLGALAFAKGLDRTLVLPPWIEYPPAGSPGPRSMQIPFDKYFQVEPLREYHRVITMEEFMETYAPQLWPVSQRIGFCYSYRRENICGMKEGNPFGPFWDNFNIDFDSYESYGPLGYTTTRSPVRDAWDTKFPASNYPVIAFSGAPAAFPVNKEHVPLHKYLLWSKFIDDQAEEFIRNELGDGLFVGIHLRHGSDWKKACDHVKNDNVGRQLFASPQCLGYNNEHGKLTYDLCFPGVDEILKKTKKAVKKIKAKGVFVATDDNPLISELTKSLKSQKVKVVVRKPKEPHVDLAILGKSHLYICNCVSSFSAFATREREASGKTTWFWGFNEEKKRKKEEL
ncbi:GDP-fucose protein O-fucosyltransferase 1-like [Saccoglossus kowalevskii]|uniref:GDP-fucose protein O-fucosyltransferase 1 n=1 Tax=Saccoglossus kowalevskii TaxID=10224 RepID=A0ABM0MEL9_SACKO|nr:PREDICTED: GDP-fucose protein O-fucosyltransferase 1-like [Saccoglossus kowalevskii]